LLGDLSKGGGLRARSQKAEAVRPRHLMVVTLITLSVCVCVCVCVCVYVCVRVCLAGLPRTQTQLSLTHCLVVLDPHVYACVYVCACVTLLSLALKT
jgi:hypothetical protein